MKKLVLVVEDNEQNLYLVTFLLEKNGYEVIAARDGAEGVRKAKQERPDLILMDMRLPIMDGYEATRQVKSFPELKATPVIALTAYAMRGDRERTLEAGCDAYVEKPIVPEDLIRVVENCLK